MSDLIFEESPPKVGSQLIPIGRFSRATRLSVKTLRFYDEVSLLSPAAVDPSSGYRYYHPDQLEVAERIRLLRSLDLPVEEVREILQETDAQIVIALIARHRRRIGEQIARYERTLKALDELNLSGNLYQPVLKNLPPQFVLAMRLKCELRVIESARLRAFEEVAQLARSQQIGLSGPRISLSVECNNHLLDVLGHKEDFDVLNDSKLLLNDVGWLIEAPVAVQEPFTVRELPPMRVASVLHLGPYEPLHLAHQATIGWARQNGLVIEGSGWEIYWNDASNSDHPDQFRTEVQYPVG